MSPKAVQRFNWQGYQSHHVECYYGIRYARLVHADQPKGAIIPIRSEQIDAKKLTDVPIFPQLPSRLESVTGPGGRDNPQDENAFFLNVWTPQNAQKLPVMVYIHGGAWASGGGSVRWYRGQQLAAEGAVVVTLNYRLGPAGHFDSTHSEQQEAQGHGPLQDLIAALQWVRDSIAEFGGDPERVTVAGQSAGAWYAWALASLPESMGLLSQVAILSLPRILPWTPAQRTEYTQKAQVFAQFIEADSKREVELKSGIQMLGGLPRQIGAMPPMYLPTLDKNQRYILENADSSAKHLHVKAVYIRVTWHEMSVFLPPEVWTESGAKQLTHELQKKFEDNHVVHHPAPHSWSADTTRTIGLSSWQEFGQFAEELSEAFADAGIPVVFREFAQSDKNEQFGAVHCMDLPFQFGNYDDWMDAPLIAGWQRGEFEQLSELVRRDLFAFIEGHHDRVRRILQLKSSE